MLPSDTSSSEALKKSIGSPPTSVGRSANGPNVRLYRKPHMSAPTTAGTA